ITYPKKLWLPHDFDIDEKCKRKYSECENVSNTWSNVCESKRVMKENMDMRFGGETRCDFETDLKTRKIRLYPTLKERETLLRWINTTRWTSTKVSVNAYAIDA
ncbi:24951_t:CDS:1, partial [Racocetra persica]